MRGVVKRAAGDLHSSSRRGTSAGLQLKMLQQQGLLPLLLETKAGAPVWIQVNGRGSIFSLLLGREKRTGGESKVKHTDAGTEPQSW